MSKYPFIYLFIYSLTLEKEQDSEKFLHNLLYFVKQPVAAAFFLKDSDSCDIVNSLQKFWA